MNLQNLTRGSQLRYAIEAPPGHMLLAADQAQIEARCNAVASGERKLVEAFASGEDVYCKFASIIYGKPINKDDHPDERFVGKVAVLSLGYGASADRFRDMLRGYGNRQSKAFCGDVVQRYRSTYDRIKNFWDQSEYFIKVMAEGGRLEHPYFRVEPNALVLPNNTRIHYPKLSRDMGEWTYEYRGITKTLYGAKFVENVVQALSRIIVLEQCLEISFTYPWVHAVHDEGIFVVPEDEVDEAKKLITKVMTTPPEWMPDIPLNIEINAGKNYGACK